MEYVDARRMEQARQLLENSDLPIKAIGATIGYPAPDHFSKRFRQLNGLSPQEFRSQAGAQIL
jgi:transcriptional regulator GlxA family with amidase domain